MLDDRVERVDPLLRLVRIDVGQLARDAVQDRSCTGGVVRHSRTSSLTLLRKISLLPGLVLVKSGPVTNQYSERRSARWSDHPTRARALSASCNGAEFLVDY
ncbi:hypothetical protein GCM10027070_26370 [Barrientosiimonas humi]